MNYRNEISLYLGFGKLIRHILAPFYPLIGHL